MGQRAIFAIKEATNVYITTVQWATHTPEFFRDAIVNMSSNDNNHGGQVKELQDVLLSISSEVIKYDHIGNFTISDNKVMCDYGDLGKPEKVTVKNRTEFINRVMSHDHAQDGYSVLVDLDANRMDFWIDSEWDIMIYPTDDKGFVVGDFGSITRDNYLIMPK